MPGVPRGRGALGRATAALLLAAVHAGALHAQGTAYHPGIDVVDYDIRLVLPDTGAFLRGDVRVLARRARETRTLRLDLVDRLQVREVSVDGAPVSASHRSGKIDVPLDAARGDTVRVRVVYDGVVADGLVAQKDGLGRWTWFGDNWPDRAREWLPVVDHPSDKATVAFTVRAPSARTVVANGVLLGTTRLTDADEGLTETRWRESHPIPTYLMVIGAGTLMRVPIADSACVASAVHRCTAQDVYAMPELRGWLPGPFRAAPSIVSHFESLVGPFPYDKLSHLQSATRFGGMENASAIFYADRLFRDRTLREGLIAHETAHQWFGDAVTEREWAHLWLSEGFATYFAALWTRHAYGDPAWAKEMRDIRSRILVDSIVAKRPVLDTAQRDFMQLLNANSYEKGGYVLYMLHRRLGDSTFFAGVRAYYAAHRYGTASTDDLRAAFERASGQDLRAWFDQWLRRPGVAELSVGWAWDADDASVTLLTLQGGSAYDLPLVVAVTDAAGVTTRVEVPVPAAPRASVRLPGRFIDRPQRIRLDPDALLLARLTPL